MEQATELSLTTPLGPLSALAWGDPTKPPILALHGWLDNAASFAPLGAHLSDCYLVALDLPGHGHSAWLPEGGLYHFIDYSRWVWAAYQALGWSGCYIMGHSLGGAIALHLAAALPERFHGLIMLDAIGPLTQPAKQAPRQLRQGLLAKPRPHTLFKDFDQAVQGRLRVNLTGAIKQDSVRLLAERGVLGGDRGYYWAHDPRLQLPTLLHVHEEQVYANLAAVQQPTLLILAEQGLLRLDPVRVAARQQQLVNAVQHTIPGGHHVHMDDSHTIGRLINDYLFAQPPVAP